MVQSETTPLNLIKSFTGSREVKFILMGIPKTTVNMKLQ